MLEEAGNLAHMETGYETNARVAARFESGVSLGPSVHHSRLPPRITAFG